MRSTTTLLLLAVALSSSACTSICVTGACATQAAAQFARDEGFTVEQTEGDGYLHQVYWRAAKDSNTVWIFVEGDGHPWSKDGKFVMDDPTATYPLALRLAALSKGAVAYLGRPCYLSAVRDHRCTPATWTMDRYSNAVVVSMNAAAKKLAVQLHASQVVLVGHSGGGALAALMARELPAAAIVTIAANLDVTAWAAEHGYLPLTGSRNPADEPPLPESVLQLHLLGGQDSNVTESMSARYLDRVPIKAVQRYQSFDHSCCWTWEWPAMQRKVARELATRRQ